MGANSNEARALVTKAWGFNWLETIPLEFRSALKYKTTRVPGVSNGTNPDALENLVISSKTETNRINEIEKETIELDTDLELPITLVNKGITTEYGGGEIDTIMVLTDGDLEVGEGVNWVSYDTKTLNATRGIRFSVGKRLSFAYVDAVILNASGSGYTGGSYTNGTFTGGGGSGATFNYTVSGGAVTSVTRVNAGNGYTSPPTPVFNAGPGTGASATALLGGWPEIVDDPFDPEMKVPRIIRRRVVDPLYPADLNPVNDGFVVELKGIDKWHSSLEISSRTPTATSEGTAILSTSFRPFKFPGFVVPYILANGSPVYLHRKASAVITPIELKTWWVTSPTKPTKESIGVVEIIADSVQVLDTPYIGSVFSVRVDDVLHDIIVRTDLGRVFPATSPSYSEYFSALEPIQLTGTVTATSGSTSITGSGTSFTTQVIIGDLFFGFPITAIASNTGFTIGQPWPIPTITFPLNGAYIQHVNGTPWVGSSRVVGADITPEKEKNLWKIVTQNVVMR